MGLFERSRGIQISFLATALLVAVCYRVQSVHRPPGDRSCQRRRLGSLRHGDDEMKERTFRGSVAIVLSLVLLFSLSHRHISSRKSFLKAIGTGPSSMSSYSHDGKSEARSCPITGSWEPSRRVWRCRIRGHVWWSGGLVTYAHNFVLQAIADRGAIISLIIACLLLAGVLGLLKRAKWRAECVALAVGIGLLF